MSAENVARAVLAEAIERLEDGRSFDPSWAIQTVAAHAHENAYLLAFMDRRPADRGEALAMMKASLAASEQKHAQAEGLS